MRLRRRAIQIHIYFTVLYFTVSNEGKPNASNICYTVVLVISDEFLYTFVRAVFNNLYLFSLILTLHHFVIF